MVAIAGGMGRFDPVYTSNGRVTVQDVPAHTYVTPLDYVTDVVFPVAAITSPVDEEIPAGNMKVWKIQTQADPPNVYFTWDEDGTGETIPYLDGGLWFRVTCYFNGLEWMEGSSLMSNDGPMDAVYAYVLI